MVKAACIALETIEDNDEMMRLLDTLRTVTGLSHTVYFVTLNMQRSLTIAASLQRVRFT